MLKILLFSCAALFSLDAWGAEKEGETRPRSLSGLSFALRADALKAEFKSSDGFFVAGTISEKTEQQLFLENLSFDNLLRKLGFDEDGLEYFVKRGMLDAIDREQRSDFLDTYRCEYLKLDKEIFPAKTLTKTETGSSSKSAPIPCSSPFLGGFRKGEGNIHIQMAHSATERGIKAFSALSQQDEESYFLKREALDNALECWKDVDFLQLLHLT